MGAQAFRTLLQHLDRIPHVEEIRLHSRKPVSDPAAITADHVAAMAALQNTGLWLVAHINHAAEITPEAADLLKRIRQADVPILSQTVLLKGVNATETDLHTLLRTLIRHKIKPYYLHHPDQTPGTDHFRISLAEGQALVRTVWRTITGIAKPTYVLDVPGGHGKIIIPIDDIKAHPSPPANAPTARTGKASTQWDVKTPSGETIVYDDCL
jgi:lysine 2,3-aminomutase